VILVKIGGGDAINLAGIAEDLSGVAEPVIVVHGANQVRDRLASALGVELERVTSVSGMSSVLSDDKTIDLMMMAYAGLRNKRLVELLQRSGVNAVGLSGLDGRAVSACRNPGIRVREDGKRRLLRDLSGRPAAVNRELLDLLLEAGYTPVLTMPLADEQGVAVNSENDDVVALLHRNYHASVVVQLIEAPGLLADPDDEASRIERLSRRELAAWEEHSDGRIRRKLHAIGGLLDAGPTRLVIGDGRIPHPVRAALDGAGTVIQ
jgi:acetylglutamate/LysW-gamma-L-alpha-aminoadipate kinase